MYSYQEQKKKLFTEEGQVIFLRIRDNTNKLIEQAGVVTMEKAMSVVTGNNWDAMACVDRLVELGEIREVDQSGRFAAQHRIFKKPS